MAVSATYDMVSDAGVRTTHLTGATGEFNFGNAADARASVYVFQIYANGATFSFVPCKKITDGTMTDANAVVCNYASAYATTTNIAGTAIAAAAMIEVPSNGADIIFRFTANNGTVIVESRPIFL